MTRIKEPYKILAPILLIIAHIGLVLMIFYGSWQEWSITLFLYFLMACVGHDITYHRLLSHRSYNPPKWFEYFGTFIGVYGMLGTPLGWASFHREHHRYSDTPNDPHSPHYKSFVEIIWLIVLREAKVKYARDILRSKFQMWVHTHYIRIHVVIFTVLYVINPWAVVYLYLAPAAINWIMIGILNIWGHMWGYRNFQSSDKSKNSILGLLTFGEGWHNNHHAHPERAILSEYWWEFDIAGILIKLLDPSAK